MAPKVGSADALERAAQLRARLALEEAARKRVPPVRVDVERVSDFLPPPKAPITRYDFDFDADLLAPRTEETALKQMDGILLGPTLERSENDATVVRDAPNVNNPEDTGTLINAPPGGQITSTSSERHLAAEAQLEANAALERAALAKLSPEEAAKYAAIKAACLAAGDPVAALALQKLLFSGKLPGIEDLKGGGTLLDNLATIADPNTPLAEGLDRGAFLCDLVQEVATPSSISQGNIGTCGPTAAIIDLAMKNPAEYARIALGLASPEGTVELAGGQVISREDGTLGKDPWGRSTVQALMGAAFMEIANEEQDYDDSQSDTGGAGFNGLDRLMEQIWDTPMQALELLTAAEKTAAAQALYDATAQGETAVVSMAWGDPPTGAHAVLVVGTETIGGVEYVRYINPWGREERMTKEEFERRLQRVHSAPPETEESSGGGGGGSWNIDNRSWVDDIMRLRRVNHGR